MWKFNCRCWEGMLAIHQLPRAENKETQIIKTLINSQINKNWSFIDYIANSLKLHYLIHSDVVNLLLLRGIT
ncbi:hypothetical protein FDUTEX481_05772 [Tolypothrix sp. PCC 7601]|nr:hypothetical protein FDUTEX481_05772 [Tolypothrix sp. PCC 7601]